MSPNNKKKRPHHHPPGPQRHDVGTIVQVIPCTKRRGTSLDIFQGKAIGIRDGKYVVKNFTAGCGTKPWSFGEVQRLGLTPAYTAPLGRAGSDFEVEECCDKIWRGEWPHCHRTIRASCAWMHVRWSFCCGCAAADNDGRPFFLLWQPDDECIRARGRMVSLATRSHGI